MTPTRRLATFAVAAMLVWSVAFGGGYTVALFTANAEVSGTFETVADFDESKHEVALEAAPSNGNATAPPNATTPPNATAPPNANGSAPPKNGSAEYETDATERIGNGGLISDTPTGNEIAPAPDEPTAAEASNDESDDPDDTGSDEFVDSDEGVAADDSEGESSDESSDDTGNDETGVDDDVAAGGDSGE